MGGVSMLFTVVVLGGMMFFMTRNQKKQQNQRQTLLDSMKVGDDVVTIGGLHGVVSDLDDTKKTVLIDCEGIILEFDRAAIKTVTPVTPGETVIVEEPVEIVTEEVIEVQEASNETTEKEDK